MYSKQDDYLESGVEVDFDSINNQKRGDPHAYDKQHAENIETKGEHPKEVYKKLAKRYNGVFSLYSSRPAASGIQETPSEKFNRLKAEIQELKEGLTLMADKNKDNAVVNFDEEKEVLSEVANLEKDILQIAEVRAWKDYLNSEAIKDLGLEDGLAINKTEFQKTLSQHLNNKIQELSTLDSLPTGKDDKIAFEIYLNKEESKLKGLLRFQELEKRLTNIEKTIGVGQNLKSETNLVSRVDSLYKLANCLNSQRIDELPKKIVVINSEIDDIIRKNKEQSIGEEDFKKIDQLYDNFQKSQAVIDEIPNIVERLESLKVLHEESADLASSINNLSAVQTQISQSLGENNELLRKVEENFSKNLSTIQSNLKNLEERVSRLK